MGRVDQFIAEEFPQIKEKEKKERELEGYYSSLAGEFLGLLKSYKSIFGVEGEAVGWYEFFKNYLERIKSSPRIVTYVDDFVLKQLTSLLEKCPREDYFAEGMEAFSFWALLYLPALFFASLYLISHGKQDLFLKVALIGGGVFPLFSRRGRRMIPAYALLLALLGYFPDFFLNLSWFWKVAFLGLYSLVFLSYQAAVYAKARCAAFAFPISFGVVQELFNRLKKEASQ